MSRPATTRLKVNAVLGTKPALRWLRLEEMAVDAAYQRSLAAEKSVTLVRSIAQYWDWDLCQPLTVAKRPNGALMIVDGQHRHAAAKLRGDIETLPCVVTAFATIGDEAAAFVALNRQRKPLSKLDLFKAALAADDESARAIAATLDACGLRVAAHSNYTAWKPGDVSNIGGIESVWRHHGRSVVEPALRAIASAFTGEVLRYAGTIFPGLAAFLVGRPSARNGAEFARLVAILKTKGQPAWRKAIMNRRAESGSRADRAGREVLSLVFGGRIDGPATIPPPKTPKPPLTFEQQLAAVANGARLVEVQPLRRADPTVTLGGVTGEINP